MSVQYCLHIFDSARHPLTMEDLYIQSQMIFWPPERLMFEKYYENPDLMENDELVAEGRAQLDLNRVEFERVEREYLKRWLTPEGEYPGTEWWKNSQKYKWTASELSWNRILETPYYDFGDDYCPPALNTMKLLGVGLVTLDQETIQGILSVNEEGASFYDNDEHILLVDFLEKYRNHQAFMITH